MARALLRWGVLSIAVWIAAAVVPGIRYDRWQSLLIAALVLSLLNTFAKPALRILSLPFVIFTFGLFLLVINAILLGLTAWLVPGFSVSGFWPAAWGSLVISIVSLFMGCSDGGRRVVIRRDDDLFSDRRGPPPGRGPIIDV